MSTDSTISNLPKVAFAVWKDATADATWKPFDETGIDTCYAFGFVTKEDTEFITFSATVGELEANASISIPRGMIVSLSYLPLDTLMQLTPSTSVSKDDPTFDQ